MSWGRGKALPNLPRPLDTAPLATRAREPPGARGCPSGVLRPRPSGPLEVPAGFGIGFGATAAEAAGAGAASERPPAREAAVAALLEGATVVAPLLCVVRPRWPVAAGGPGDAAGAPCGAAVPPRARGAASRPRCTGRGFGSGAGASNSSSSDSTMPLGTAERTSAAGSSQKPPQASSAGSATFDTGALPRLASEGSAATGAAAAAALPCAEACASAGGSKTSATGFAGAGRGAAATAAVAVAGACGRAARTPRNSPSSQ
mmetsp:Transcript_73462/g.238947  ORF Transcript_73462/g.238947 Transcript_73462/m.238947 type:complete len:260 (+) Transcript_73462:1768-2547(+)